MMNVFENNYEIQQKMQMLIGDDKKSELTKQQEKEIAKNYANMFFALATIRWCNGQNLGSARQKSLEQMDNFVKSKTKVENPMNKYLSGINNQYRRFISELNMSDKNSDKKIGLNPELAKKWSENASQNFQKSLAILNDLYKKYMPNTEQKKQNNTVIFKVAHQNAEKLMQMIMKQQKMNQRDVA